MNNNFALGLSHPEVSDKKLINCKADVNQLQPIKYQWAWDSYQTAKRNYWIPEKVNMNADALLWRSTDGLSEQERRIVEINLGFFSTADSLVANNIVLAIYRHITNPECRQFLLFQAAQEALHTDSYNYCIDSLGIDNKHIFNMYNTVPSVTNKDAWALQFINEICEPSFKTGTFETDSILLKNLCVFFVVFEGIFFYAGFAQMLALGHNGKMTGITDQFRYILKDESLHFTFGIQLINEIIRENPHLWTKDMQEDMRRIIKEGAELEIAYSNDVIREPILGMSAKENKEYLQYIANMRCKQINLEPVFPKSVQPFDWMDTMINLSVNVNFFERTNTNYQTTALNDWD